MLQFGTGDLLDETARLNIREGIAVADVRDPEWSGTWYPRSVEWRGYLGTEIVLTRDADAGMTARAFTDAVKAMAKWPRVLHTAPLTLRAEQSTIKRSGLFALVEVVGEGILLVPSINRHFQEDAA